MSGSHPTPVEQHLGDRLAALVDGELGHDTRERVLAHLATCPKCKAEADAQRRLKSVFAETAPPPPSASLLARLQGLPGGDGGGDDSDPFGGGGSGSGRAFRTTPSSGLRPQHPLRPKPGGLFGLAPSEPADPPASRVPLLPGGDHGFRIHEVRRPEAERSASRGRRFAFAAAGAVSLAAIALSGLTTGVPAASGNPAGGPPSNATPLRTTGPAPAAEAVRRRGEPPVTRGQQARSALPTPVAHVAAFAPLLPGVPTPSQHPPSSTPSTPPSATPLIR